MMLDDAALDQLADRVVERLVDRLSLEPASRPLVDAAMLAHMLGVSRSTVYDHADELGARRIGPASEREERRRMRFDVDEARAAWARRVNHEPSSPTTAPSRRRTTGQRGRTRAGAPFLQVKDTA